MRKSVKILLGLLAAALLVFCFCRIRRADNPAGTFAETTAGLPDSTAGESSRESLPESTETPNTQQSAEAVSSVFETSSSPEKTTEEASVPETTEIPEDEFGPHPKASHTDFPERLTLPPFAGEAYTAINGNVPFFDTDDLVPEAYEIYYALDELGRCTQADAVAGTELMPTEKRGNISSVRPTGWHTDKYPQSLVDGESLYNRCHLLAFGLTGENANPYNLVTGTRYFNTAGMNAFENMMIDYIRETDNHVRYRVTPLFTGDNLVCDGAILEGWSIEDEGEAICFCVYAYNVQPGIHIDYATGDNWQEGSPGPDTTEAPVKELPTLAEDREGTFVLNVKKKTFHRPDCDGAVSMSEKNRQEYTGSYNRLILDGYLPCGSCEP